MWRCKIKRANTFKPFANIYLFCHRLFVVWLWFTTLLHLLIYLSPYILGCSSTWSTSYLEMLTFLTQDCEATDLRALQQGEKVKPHKVVTKNNHIKTLRISSSANSPATKIIRRWLVACSWSTLESSGRRWREATSTSLARARQRLSNVVIVSKRSASSSYYFTLTCEAQVERTQIINPDWDFSKMGIGGLDTEFNAIFRRAFASRVFPPEIMDQLGCKHVKGILLYGPPGTGELSLSWVKVVANAVETATTAPLTAATLNVFSLPSLFCPNFILMCREDPDGSPDRADAQLSRAEDRERSPDPRQVCRRVRGEHSQALWGSWGGGETSGTKFRWHLFAETLFDWNITSSVRMSEKLFGVVLIGTQQWHLTFGCFHNCINAHHHHHHLPH